MSGAKRQRKSKSASRDANLIADLKKRVTRLEKQLKRLHRDLQGAGRLLEK
jgi:hypothetical protein